jgi:heme-degrading monooxygenase HmoA
VITEQAVLDVRPGEERDFESAFAEAKALIASMPGFESLQLHRCIEQPNRYLLLVEWRRLEDHTEGFRRSAEYEELKGSLLVSQGLCVVWLVVVVLSPCVLGGREPAEG